MPSAGALSKFNERNTRASRSTATAIVLTIAVALGALMTPAVALAAPQPRFTVSPSTSVTVGTWVQFNASSSGRRARRDLRVDFGNGDGDSAQEGAAGEDVEEPYDQAGSYTVTLTVADSTGTASTSQTVTVSSGPPTATFLVDWLYPDELGLMPPPAPGTPVTFQTRARAMTEVRSPHSSGASAMAPPARAMRSRRLRSSRGLRSDRDRHRQQ